MMGVKKRRRKKVSTHSRLKAAGSQNLLITAIGKVSTHSRLKAAGKAYLL